MDGNLSGWQRFLLAFIAFFAVLFNRRFAEEVHVVRGRLRALPAGGDSSATGTRTAIPKPAPAPAPTAPTSTSTSTTATAPATAPAAAPVTTSTPKVAPPPPADPTAPALHVLSILQRDGRLIDFLSEDLNGFSDAEIGAAARTVHEGCRKTLDTYLELEPVYREAEGARITVGQGFDPSAVRLTGNVVGQPPFQGSLKHHGWRVKRATFPPPPTAAEARILAPAEVEL
jgi:hypothetical protein